jgi:hypothetical protein
VARVSGGLVYIVSGLKTLLETGERLAITEMAGRQRG